MKGHMLSGQKYSPPLPSRSKRGINLQKGPEVRPPHFSSSPDSTSNFCLNPSRIRKIKADLHETLTGRQHFSS